MAPSASDSVPQPAQLSILRIKRKRTQQPTPLDALVIEQLEPSTKRRKATTNTRTSLDSSAPPSMPAPAASRGVFKFAETVSLDSFSTPTKTRSLRDRIQSFLSHPPPGLARSASSSSLRSASLAASAAASPRRAFAASSAANASTRPATPPATVSSTQDLASASTPTSSPRRKLPSALRAARAAAASHSTASSTSSLDDAQGIPSVSGSFDHAAGISASRGSAPSPRLSAIHAEKSRLRYRVVEQRRAYFSAQAEAAEAARRERAREDDEIRRGLRPPRVEDSRSLASKAPEVGDVNDARRGGPAQKEEDAGIKIYEAVAEGELEVPSRPSRIRAPERRAAVARITDAEQTAAMDQFGALLDEYLTLQDAPLPPVGSDLHSSHDSPPLGSEPFVPVSTSAVEAQQGSQASSDDESDYVYDVYYRATDVPRADKSVAPGAAGSASEPAVGLDVSSLAGLNRIGQLAGLAEDSDDETQLLVNNESHDGSSEEEDNADQDSNEENDYRNDYPDEDEPDSDNNRQEFRDRQADWSEDDSDDGTSDGSMQYDNSDDQY
ncbi:hypothetical protein JCM10908_007000 [Rhodotorula pacifica]|uniref:Iwr1 domain-containing protein n=1 Tax=Rhodotorula pacifica TaxID=1495444 RepID=UPI00317287A7